MPRICGPTISTWWPPTRRGRRRGGVSTDESPDCGGPGEGPPPGDGQDDQQGGNEQEGQPIPDNQQTGGDKNPAAEDDQQNTETGTGKTPDNQRGGGKGETVTKTFRLTINGTVPEGQVFGVIYGTSDDPEAFNQIIFCGQFPTGPDTATQEPDCRGGGAVYEEKVTLAKRTGIIFVYFRSTEEVPEGPEDFVFEQFHTGEEVLRGDLVNTAWYTFGAADDDRQVPNNTQGAARTPRLATISRRLKTKTPARALATTRRMTLGTMVPAPGTIPRTTPKTTSRVRCQ